MVHVKKILPGYFRDVASGLKAFEVRLNDCDYDCGDLLILNEWDPERGFTGRSVCTMITYILRDDCDFVKSGYCILSINLI